MKTYLKYVKYLAIVGGLAIAAFLLPDIGPIDAWAQTTTPADVTTTVTTTAPPLTDTQVNIATIRDTLVVIGGTVLTAILSWIGIAVRAYFASKRDLDKTTLDEKFQAIFDVAAKRGIAYSETFLKEKIPDTIDPKSVFVKTAADYIINHWPDIVKATGMTEQNVMDAVISRLPSPTGKEADQLALIKAGAAAPATIAVAAAPKA